MHTGIFFLFQHIIISSSNVPLFSMTVVIKNNAFQSVFQYKSFDVVNIRSQCFHTFLQSTTTIYLLIYVHTIS